MPEDNNGVSGVLNMTPAKALTIVSFAGVAWYNSIELQVMIWMTFRRRHGLYFYSLLVASIGIVVDALGMLLKLFNLTNTFVAITVIISGWIPMVTGQSLVLYSRLHLVVRDPRKLKWVLAMIIIDALLFHIPTTVLLYLVRPVLPPPNAFPKFAVRMSGWPADIGVVGKCPQIHECIHKLLQYL
jgi:hypothetical protein